MNPAVFPRKLREGGRIFFQYSLQNLLPETVQEFLGLHLGKVIVKGKNQDRVPPVFGIERRKRALFEQLLRRVRGAAQPEAEAEHPN